jgi:cobalt transporter subunit CbtB
MTQLKSGPAIKAIGNVQPHDSSEKGTKMTTITKPKPIVVGVTSRAFSLATIAVLGSILVVGVGFSNIPAIHDAAHDVRHTLSFPCH